MRLAAQDAPGPASRRIATALAFACAAALGCAPSWKPLPPIDVGRPSADPAAQQRAGLVVAMKPVTDPEWSRRALGTDLVRDEGVLGVLIVVENRDAGASRLLLPGAITLGAGSGTSPEVPDFEARNPLAGPAATVASLALVGAALAFPPVALAVLPFDGVIGRSLTQSRFTRHRLLLASMAGHTISPGEQVHGFAFFPLGALRAAQGPLRLVVAITDPATQAAECFVFPLELPPEDAR